MSCLFTLVSRTMELTTDVNVHEETKGFWVCAGCSWTCICLVCVGGGAHVCVSVCVLGRGEEGV